MTKPISQETIGFLRSIGLDEKAITILRNPTDRVFIDAETLVSYVRFGFAAGRTHTRDPYKWYDPAELIGMARAAERAP